MTRPLRLACQIWAAVRVRRELDYIPPRRRLESAARSLALVAAVICLGGLAMTQANKALFSWMAISPSSTFASSVFGLTTLAGGCFHPPLVVILQAIRPSFAQPTAAACSFLRGRGRDVAQLIEVGADGLRQVKPLRALLDLTETDAWFGELLLMLRATLPF